MQGGALRGFCFFALLLSTGVECSGQNPLNAEDLTPGSLEDLLDESEVPKGLGLRQNPVLEDDLDASNRNAKALATATAGANFPLSGLHHPNLVQVPSLSNSPFDGLLSPNHQSPHVGPAYSQANAEALTLAGAGLSDTGLSLADANSLAHALGGGSQGYGSAEALAKALAHVQSRPLLNAVNPSGVLNSAKAKGLAQVYGSGNALSAAQSQAQTQGGLSLAQAQALAQSLGGGSAQSLSHVQSLGLGLNPSPLDGLSSAGNFQGSALAHAMADARTRVVPAREYVLPYSLPGGQQVLKCSREGELHNFWSTAFECLICACINQGGYLAPVCASCAGCSVPPEPLPPPAPVASCDPLPTETPFENPLNPCQICTCHLTVDGYGQQDVNVLCQENPECIVPRILVPTPWRTSRPVPMVPIAMVPNPPVPIRPPGPLPGPSPHKSCRPFVPNQPFSHPWDECQECVCSESEDYGVINVEVDCYTKKECCVVTPQLPDRELLPVAPENVVYIEPRCRQQPPRLPFVVGCDVCTCETVYQYVVAKCHRTPDCDAGSLYDGGALPYGPNPSLYTVSPFSGGSRVTADASALANTGLSPYLNYGGYGSASADAESSANSGRGYASALANAEAFGGSGPGQLLRPGSLLGLAEADALANVNSGLYPGDLSGSTSSAAANALSNVGLNPLNSQVLPNLSPAYHSLALAEANSNVNSGYNPFTPGPDLLSGNSATAQAFANTLSTLNNDLNPYLVQTQPYNPSSFSLPEVEDLTNSATADANALNFLNPLYQQYYYLQPGNELLSGYNPALYQVNPYSQLSYLPNLSSESASAQAAANSNAGYNSYLPGYQTGSLSSAQAKALAQANSGLLLPGSQSSNYGSANTLSDALNSYPYGGYSPHSSADAKALAASNAYSGYSPLVNPLYQPGLGSVSNAQAQALASSRGQSLAGAQSQASALSGRPLIKSAPVEDEDNDYDVV